jgi:hypothetical protein
MAFPVALQPAAEPVETLANPRQLSNPDGIRRFTPWRPFKLVVESDYTTWVDGLASAFTTIC